MAEAQAPLTAQPGKASGTAPAEREEVRFASGGAECAAWHYPGTNGACVIMTGGFAVTKEPGTDLFARRFNQARFSVLAFDYRCFGESGGRPRQVARIREQLGDWQAAIAFAASLPGVDPAKLAVWSFSGSGGTSSESRRAPRTSVRQSPRRRTQTAWRPPATRPATRSRSRCCASPAAAFSTGWAGWPAARRGWCRKVPGLAAGSRRLVGAAARVLPARPLCRAGGLPAASGGLRPGPDRARRTRHPRGATGSSRRTGPPARRALRAVPGRA
jgi:hypothetical protein